MCILAGTAGWAQTFAGRVTEVVKGDVLVVAHGEKPEKVRAAGVDCPELAQPFGPEAKKFTSDLVLNKDVSVEQLGTDNEGKTIARITLSDGRSLDEELLTEGMGWYYEMHPGNSESLRRLAAKAITAKKGLWTDPAPLAPWDFRGDARKEREAVAAVAMAAAQVATKEQVKTVSGKGDLEGVEREVFPKPKPAGADLSAYLNNPLVKQLGISFHKDPNGRVAGIQAQNLSAFPLAAVFGFQNGDIIQSVNGNVIDSEARIPELFEKYKDTRTFTVGILRNGQPQNITVDVSNFLK
jgi:endonuclease YncB( thermonuclease family)